MIGLPTVLFLVRIWCENVREQRHGVKRRQNDRSRHGQPVPFQSAKGKRRLRQRWCLLPHLMGGIGIRHRIVPGSKLADSA